MPCRLLACLAPMLLIASCTSSPPAYAPEGDVRPTVAGASVPAYGDLASARAAYVREQGSLRATLQDAAWLRFRGTPEQVEAAHRAYFEYGYTTFEVELRSDTFTQPTTETFVLEDSTGARLEGRPLTYRGSDQLVDDAFYSTFELAFPHTLSADTRWVRLTRVADGSQVTWNLTP